VTQLRREPVAQFADVPQRDQTLLVTSEEQVVLLDDQHLPCGTAPKDSVHTEDTPLHLAFSAYLFKGDLVLLSRRALSKRTFPGVWSNSCCGHPAPGEAVEEAVRRRARQELGLDVAGMTLVLPEFGYRAVDASGIVENEHCPVFTGVAVGTPAPDPDEVEAVQWVPWADVAGGRLSVELSPWALLQVAELARHPLINGMS
jgi:isopentenyl-diphosphate delta-isomerase